MHGYVVKKLTSVLSYSKVTNQYKIFPLGDAAITLDMGNSINEALNQKALAMQQWLLAQPFEGLRDCLAAYSSITVQYNPVTVKKHYNLTTTVFDWVADRLVQAFEQSVQTEQEAKEVITHTGLLRSGLWARPDRSGPAKTIDRTGGSEHSHRYYL